MRRLSVIKMVSLKTMPDSAVARESCRYLIRAAEGNLDVTKEGLEEREARALRLCTLLAEHEG